MYQKKRSYSCVELADTYYRNDLEKKLYFYNKACEYGYAQGCYEAVKYTNDPEKKLYFFDKGCEYGLAYTCLYALDLVRGDNNKAMEYGYKACKLGDTATCKRIEGIAKKACDGGDQDGCKWLEIINNRK